MSLRRSDDIPEAAEFVLSEYDNVPNEDDREKMAKRILRWMEVGKERAYPEESMEKLERISNSWFDIPF